MIFTALTLLIFATESSSGDEGFRIPWELGWPGVAIAVCYMILRGHLVLGSEMRYWRTAYFNEQAKVEKLLLSGRVTLDVLDATEKVIRGDDTS